MGGGGAKYFFFGAEIPTKKRSGRSIHCLMRSFSDPPSAAPKRQQDAHKCQEAAQYQPLFKEDASCIFSFLWGHLLEHSFLKHFWCDQFSVIQGEVSIKRFSATSFGRTLLGSDFGGLLLEQTFGTLRPCPKYHITKRLLLTFSRDFPKDPSVLKRLRRSIP